MDSKLELKLQKKTKKYKNLTKKALEKISLIEGMTVKEKKIAQDFLQMAKNYFFDAQFFEQKKDYLTALAAYSYAHAWLDAGTRAGFFDAKSDSRLFVLP